MSIGLFIGELSAAPADVIWTSTSPQLSSFRGADPILRKRGGAELKQACDYLLEREELRTGHRQVPPGAAPASGPGPLPFHAIVHCVTFDAQGSSDDVIRSCVHNAWGTTIALKPRPQRIALPVLAADNGKFEFDSALRLVLAALESAQAQQPAPMDEIWIVLPDAQHEPAARQLLEQRFGSVAVRS